jgi:hypothetical protein
MLQSWNCRGEDVVVNEDVDEWELEWPVTGPCDSVTVSDFKPGKWGLNSRLRPVLRGGGMVLTHYVITWLEMDGQHDIRGGSSSRPSALLKISQFPHGFTVRSINTKYHYYFDWGRRYSQVRFPAIHELFICPRPPCDYLLSPGPAQVHRWGEEGGSTNWTDQRWRRHLHVLPMNFSLWLNRNQAVNIFCHTKMSADIYLKMCLIGFIVNRKQYVDYKSSRS